MHKVAMALLFILIIMTFMGCIPIFIIYKIVVKCCFKTREKITITKTDNNLNVSCLEKLDVSQENLEFDQI